MASIISEYDEDIVKKIFNVLEQNLRGLVRKDYGYTLGTGQIGNPSLEMLKENFSPPMLIKDEKGDVWIYGFGENGEYHLLKLEKDVYSHLQFPDLLVENQKNYSLQMLEELNLADSIYGNIRSHKGHVSFNHLSHFPENVSEEEGVERISDFINKEEKMKEFIQEFLNVAMHFNSSDVEHLGTAKQTSNGNNLVNLMKKLEENGIYGTRGKKINFWSGKMGCYQASLVPDEVSWSLVPSLVLMNLMKEVVQLVLNKKVPEEVLQGLSRWFALHAKGQDKVHLRLSSDKALEGPGLTVGNYLWIAELVTLQQQLHNNEIGAIMISLYDDNRVLGPFDINSPEAEPFLNLVRRTAYQPSKDDLEKALATMSAEYQEKFKSMIETGDKSTPFSMDESAPARPSMSLGKLRGIALKFGARTAQKSLKNITETDPNFAAHKEKLQRRVAKHVEHNRQYKNRDEMLTDIKKNSEKSKTMGIKKKFLEELREISRESVQPLLNMIEKLKILEESEQAKEEPEVLVEAIKNILLERKRIGRDLVEKSTNTEYVKLATQAAVEVGIDNLYSITESLGAVAFTSVKYNVNKIEESMLTIIENHKVQFLSRLKKIKQAIQEKHPLIDIEAELNKLKQDFTEETYRKYLLNSYLQDETLSFYYSNDAPYRLLLPNHEMQEIVHLCNDRLAMLENNELADYREELNRIAQEKELIAAQVEIGDKFIKKYMSTIEPVNYTRKIDDLYSAYKNGDREFSNLAQNLEELEAMTGSKLSEIILDKFKDEFSYEFNEKPSDEVIARFKVERDKFIDSVKNEKDDSLPFIVNKIKEIRQEVGPEKFLQAKNEPDPPTEAITSENLGDKVLAFREGLTKQDQVSAQNQEKDPNFTGFGSYAHSKSSASESTKVTEPTHAPAPDSRNKPNV